MVVRKLGVFEELPAPQKMFVLKQETSKYRELLTRALGHLREYRYILTYATYERGPETWSEPAVVEPLIKEIEVALADGPEPPTGCPRNTPGAS